MNDPEIRVLQFTNNERLSALARCNFNIRSSEMRSAMPAGRQGSNLRVHEREFRQHIERGFRRAARQENDLSEEKIVTEEIKLEMTVWVAPANLHFFSFHFTEMIHRLAEVLVLFLTHAKILMIRP